MARKVLEAATVKKPKTKGKARKNNHKSELELLREENRTLKSIIRHLKKDISGLSKDHKRLEDLEEIVQDEIVPFEQDTKCPECLRGNISIVSMGPRSMEVCNQCYHRRVIRE